MRVGLGGLIIVAGLLVAVPGRAAEGERRVPWTSGRVTGSPEKPPEFELRRAYPKLRFSEPVDIEFVAEGNRVVVAEQRGKIFSFRRGDVGVEQADVMVNVKEVVDFKSVPNCRGFDSVYGIAFHPKFAENRFVFVCYALDMGQRQERNKINEMSITQCSATFKKDDNEGSPNIQVQVIDYSNVDFAKALSTAWTAVEIDKESDDGFEKTVKVKGSPGHLRWQKEGKHGEVQVLVGGRYIVTVNTDNVPSEQVIKVAEALALDKLAELK